jgi:phage-related minor tail protein
MKKCRSINKRNSTLNVSENEEHILSPEWHGSILNKRENLINSGQASYIELSKMKKDIHDAKEEILPFSQNIKAVLASVSEGLEEADLKRQDD